MTRRRPSVTYTRDDLNCPFCFCSRSADSPCRRGLGQGRLDVCMHLHGFSLNLDDLSDSQNPREELRQTCTGRFPPLHASSRGCLPDQPHALKSYTASVSGITGREPRSSRFWCWQKRPRSLRHKRLNWASGSWRRVPLHSLYSLLRWRGGQQHNFDSSLDGSRCHFPMPKL
jgi:hypothetical protein